MRSDRPAVGALTWHIVLTLILLGASGQAAEKELAGKNGKWKITTQNNVIDIVFTPDPSKTSCDKIVFIQTCKLVWYDDEGNKETLLPSAATVGWEHMDDDATDSKTFVDHLFCERDPYYNGDDPQDQGDQGKAGAGAPLTPAKMEDTVRVRDASFPPGKVKVVCEFETGAFCAEGKDAGTCYGSVRWEYTRQKGENGDGTVSLSSTAEEKQSDEHKKAVNKFQDKHHEMLDDGTQAAEPTCPEKSEGQNEGWWGNHGIGLNGPIRIRANDDYCIMAGMPTGVTKSKSTLGPFYPVDGHYEQVGGSQYWMPVVEKGDYIRIPEGESVILFRQLGQPYEDHVRGFDLPAEFDAMVFMDAYEGKVEMVQSGVFSGWGNSGFCIRDYATDTGLAVAAPPASADPEAIVMFWAEVTPENDSVTFHNDALSSHPVHLIDVAGASEFQGEPGQSVSLEPGEEITLHYPGQMTDVPPMQPPESGLTVDDFESYTNDSPHFVFQTWLDGTGFWPDEFWPEGYEGNGSGATVGHYIWFEDTPYTSVMETTIVHGGEQSMPLYYTNLFGIDTSLAERKFDPPLDCTLYDTLLLWVHGGPDNTGGQFFVGIDDHKVYPEVDVRKPEWQEVKIDLALFRPQPEPIDSDVISLCIGVDGARVGGIIYIDDIRLIPKAVSQ